jgi:hypothetical protein
MKNLWGGEGAESTEELDWETHTEGELKKKTICKNLNQ